MCTATTYKTKDFYFGRTLDYDFSYGESVVITPRSFLIPLRYSEAIKSHYAIIGMATVIDGFPLYFEGINDKGLGVAGLNFVHNAHYNHEKSSSKTNIAQFEFIPYILSKAKNVEEAIGLIDNLNIMDTPFSSKLPCAELHYLIADSNRAITVEFVKDGTRIYENPVGVLANNPPFDKQLFNLNNYRRLTHKDIPNTFGEVELEQYSRGMGAMGLPGDLSSQSRFVRVAFVKLNSLSKDDEKSSVSQFFHILNSVDQQRGCCEVKEGEFEITLYTSCYNTNRGIMYYTTYDNHQISSVDMHHENLDSDELVVYQLVRDEKINYQN